MSDYDPSDPSAPISWMAPNAYIPDLWRRRDAEYWRTARDAMSRTWTPQPPPYHEELLESARRLIAEGDDKKYQLAVVLVQAACETLTEQVVAALIAGVEPTSLREWIDERAKMRNDLDDDRARDLYVALLPSPLFSLHIPSETCYERACALTGERYRTRLRKRFAGSPCGASRTARPRVR